jgi:hypothetical protein
MVRHTSGPDFCLPIKTVLDPIVNSYPSPASQLISPIVTMCPGK